MKQQERGFLKKILLGFLLILAAYILAQVVSTMVLENEYTDYVFQYGQNEQYNSLKPDQLELKMDTGGILSLKEFAKEDGWITMTLVPEKSGTELGTVINKKTGEELAYLAWNVTSSGVITDLSTGNFTHYRLYHLYIVLLTTAWTILLWISFVLAQKKFRFSHQSIFFSGLAIWMTVLSAVLWVTWFTEDFMVNTYSIIQGMAKLFITVSLLPMLVFCIALSISNISLIRHEGFRTRNALGIALSFVMIIGGLIAIAPSLMDYVGSEQTLKMLSAFTGIYDTIYAFLECFLIGAILCGTVAARHEPEYDMDYLVILGCKVRPDGTLYPLIQGRVDAALRFYKKQLEKTGKKAVFVPSGGQGSDETISEAEAMRRYLLKQGIPEEQIMIEDKSKTTAQNMRFSKKLIEERTPGAKVAFSTTNYHVFRSGIIARENNFDIDGMGGTTKWYFWPNAYMREVIGMMAFKWKSIVIILVPIAAFLFISNFTF